ncbi:transmembrane protease serine 4a isoform X2 [Clupea harengus]|nr:transmembrane protease serine 4a isoform X2 [Clupea harengus]
MATQEPQKKRRVSVKKAVITTLAVLAVLAILAVAAYFIKQLVESKYFFCSRSLKFVPLDVTCDGKQDCSAGEDESTCVSAFETNVTFPVRLASNRSVLQVYTGQSGWKSVCAEGFTQQHTEMACNQLGYTSKPSFSAVSARLVSSTLGTSFSVVGPSRGKALQKIISDRKVCSSGSVVTLTCSDCGSTGTKDRIVGGVGAEIEDWPWQVSLQQNGQHTCGGTLVSPLWVVTAAHCFSDSKKEVSRWRVVSGRTYMGTTGGSAVEKIILNSNYNTRTNDFDIAMIKLSGPISVSDVRRPVCLPPAGLGLRGGNPLVVTGWGYLEENGKVSPNLQKAEVPYIDRSQCSSPTIYGKLITPRMLCAGFLNGSVDACQGDSGGPLVSLSDRWKLVGVVSWGVGCARENRPGVYCNVDELLNWIHSVMEL